MQPVPLFRQPPEGSALVQVDFTCEACRRSLGSALCWQDELGYGIVDTDRRRRTRHIPVGLSDPASTLGSKPGGGWHGPKTGAARLWAEGAYLYWQCGCGAPLRQRVEALFRHVLQAKSDPVRWTLKRAGERRFRPGARLSPPV